MWRALVGSPALAASSSILLYLWIDDCSAIRRPHIWILIGVHFFSTLIFPLDGPQSLPWRETIRPLAIIVGHLVTSTKWSRITGHYRPYWGVLWGLCTFLSYTLLTDVPPPNSPRGLFGPCPIALFGLPFLFIFIWMAPRVPPDAFSQGVIIAALVLVGLSSSAILDYHMSARQTELDFMTALGIDCNEKVVLLVVVVVWLALRFLPAADERLVVIVLAIQIAIGRVDTLDGDTEEKVCAAKEYYITFLLFLLVGMRWGTDTQRYDARSMNS
jgi:hypothetical protein